MRLIDFEFGGRNLRGFDLATHLSHWAGGATDGLYDDEAFPSAAEVGAFLHAYATAAADDAAGVTAPVDADALAASLAAEVQAATPLAHACWGLWALCALPRPSEGDGAVSASLAPVACAPP